LRNSQFKVLKLKKKQKTNNIKHNTTHTHTQNTLRRNKNKAEKPAFKYYDYREGLKTTFVLAAIHTMSLVPFRRNSVKLDQAITTVSCMDYRLALLLVVKLSRNSFRYFLFPNYYFLSSTKEQAFLPDIEDKGDLSIRFVDLSCFEEF